MLARTVLAVLVPVGLALASGAQALELRPAVNRPDVTEIGDPILISRELLDRELARNSEMRSYVGLYGWPDYVEVQEVTVQEPLAPYEVRLYYLRRNHEVAYSRVNVSPAIRDFGVRMYEGPIPEETLDRLLTAHGEVLSTPSATAPEEPSDAGKSALHASSDDEVEAALIRLEAAADRAALAAEMAERASAAAVMSADHANAVLDKIAVR